MKESGCSAVVLQPIKDVRANKLLLFKLPLMDRSDGRALFIMDPNIVIGMKGRMTGLSSVSNAGEVRKEDGGRMRREKRGSLRRYGVGR